ncbi:MAG: SDR family NAD(P)-dependent oxidoreductase [Deltaproteobacteria bacterium]|nr:SDR family NAD(P)-dependent oxidoreductase [Deltaproteobacteria bacterium]
MQPFSIRRLDDDTAFITGASAGIGRATAFKLAALGARVVLGARRVDRLHKVKAEIEAEVPAARVAAVAVDVTDRTALAAWLKEGEQALGPCSILVDNAGLALGRAHVADTTSADQDTVLDVNVRAAFDLVRLVLPGMKARGRGDLVLMASVAGSEPYAGGAVYCASKAAMQAFARSLRAELLGTDIRVLTLDPGLVETEFAMVRFGGDAAAAKKPYEGLTPLSADDVADCAAFALSRPRHMSLDRMLILAQAQLGTQAFARKP